MSLFVGFAPGLVGRKATASPVSNWWSSVSDGSPLLVYDSSSEVTEVSGEVYSWDPVLGGTAADVLNNYTATRALYTPNDTTYFPGRPAIYTTGSYIGAPAQALRSIDEPNSLLTSQPYDIFALVRTNVIYDMTFIDGVDVSNRCNMDFRSTPRYYLYAGAGAIYTTSIYTDAFALWLHLEGSSSFIRTHFSTGTNQYSGLLNPGTHDMRGFSLFSPYSGGAASQIRTMGFGRFSGVTTDDWNRLITWTADNLGWS